MSKKIRIAFFYNDFYPVKGGGSVHGYNLAKALSNIGYQISTIYKADETFTTRKPKNFINILKLILTSDIVYVRQGLAINYKAFLPLLGKLCNKKCIVELNSIGDELRVNGKNEYSIKKYESRLRFFLSFADSVIVVSDTIKKYCNEILDYHKIFVIENGGEKFDLSNINVTSKTREVFARITENSDKIVVWSGTKTYWQGYNLLKETIRQLHGHVAFVIITNDQSLSDDVKGFDNVYCFLNLPRDDVKYLIANSNIGLALYGDYSWSRYGFYGSSLKYYEYLINGLYVIASPLGQMAEDRYKNLFISDDVNEIVQFIRKVNISKDPLNNVLFRSWQDVGMEVDKTIRSVLASEKKSDICAINYKHPKT
jgi:glycosyltransferase involved in cell wall biosynthesis